MGVATGDLLASPARARPGPNLHPRHGAARQVQRSSRGRARQPRKADDQTGSASPRGGSRRNNGIGIKEVWEGAAGEAPPRAGAALLRAGRRRQQEGAARDCITYGEQPGLGRFVVHHQTPEPHASPFDGDAARSRRTRMISRRSRAESALLAAPRAIVSGWQSVEALSSPSLPSSAIRAASQACRHARDRTTGDPVRQSLPGSTSSTRPRRRAPRRWRVYEGPGLRPGGRGRSTGCRNVMPMWSEIRERLAGVRWAASNVDRTRSWALVVLRPRCPSQSRNNACLRAHRQVKAKTYAKPTAC